MSQMCIDDIIGQAIEQPKETFSGAVVRMDPTQELRKFDTSKWAHNVRALYEVMLAVFPAFAKKSWLADQAGFGGHAFSARKSDLKDLGVLMEKRKPKDSNEYEYRLLPPKTEADQLPDNYFPTPTDAH